MGDLKINNITYPYERDGIGNIYLNGMDKADKKYWIHEKKGHYTVKSGYWSLYKNTFLHQNPDAPSTSRNEDMTWGAIWDMHIPPKIKIFIWKATHGAIATEANLHKHHIPINFRCVLCGFGQIPLMLFYSVRRQKRDGGIQNGGRGSKE